MTAQATQTTQAPLAGLSEAEVVRRRAVGQGNTAIPLTGRTYWQIVRENVFTFINSCLFALGLTLLLLRRPLDALISTGVILLNVLVSVVQEIRAKRTLDQIALLTRPTATVVRDSVTRAVPPEELVLGDLLTIAPGDQVVVDGRLAEGRISVDESQLTGESRLVEKQQGDELFSGSFCVVGSAFYIAEKVGAASLVHQMTLGARAFRRVLTPLQREIHRVIRITLVIVIYCEFLLLLRSLLQRVDLVTSVQNSTIVASLIPNGLFLSISVAYALAAVRIIRFGALVQQANAIESLSHVDVVCLDKTGTLTANRLVLSTLVPLTVSETELRRALGDFVAMATTRNKTSDAILAACPGHQRRVTAEVPFSSARKWSALALDDPGGGTLVPRRGVYVLGAPEMLAPYLATPSAADTEAGEPTLARRIRPLADEGLRVLLLAHLDDPRALQEGGDHAQLPAGLHPLGLVALCDELRPEAQTALAALIQAGVQPKIISGDSPETVLALARQAGMREARMVSGSELDHMDEAQLMEAATTATVFGRVTPQQKERLVRALRQSGRYVAMIGDGVNDVLSLKQADVGIAMKSGSQATRGVADIVLMQDSFAALAPAVTEGQRILNGMLSILQLFLTRIGTIGAIVFSSLVIGEFPLALRHGSLVTLFSVGIPTVLLAFWAPPGLPRTRLVSRLFHFVAAPVLVTSVIALPLLYGTFLLELQRAGALAPHVAPLRALELDTAIRPVAQTTLAIFLVFVGLLLVIFAAPPTRWWAVANELSSDLRPAWLAVGLMAAFILVLLAPPLRGIFALAPVSPLEIALVAIALPLWLVVVRWLWSTRLLPRLVAG
jgi:cation-transporting ATPase E